MNNYSQRKKDKSDSSNEAYLETRNKTGEDNKYEQMPVYRYKYNLVDNHADISCKEDLVK